MNELILNVSNNSYGIGDKIKYVSEVEDLERCDLNDLLETTINLMTEEEVGNCMIEIAGYDRMLQFADEWVQVMFNGGERVYKTRINLIDWDCKVDMVINVDSHEVERKEVV